MNGWVFCFLLAAQSLVLNQDPQVTTEDRKVLIERHNYWREQVGIGPLEWSDELAQVAAKWGAQLKRKKCDFSHSDYPYGENLWMGTTGYYTVTDVVDSWANERLDYNYEKNKCRRGKMCGHYTQIVWANTKKVGCAKVECDGNTIWVCEYDPPGNWVGEKPY